MSRKGGSRIAPSLTIRIVPPCSTTNSRPLPSPALATSSGAENPATATVACTVWPVGSNGAAGVDGAPDGEGPLGPADDAIEADAVGTPAAGLPAADCTDDVVVGPQAAATIAIAASTMTTERPERSGSIGRC